MSISTVVDQFASTYLASQLSRPAGTVATYSILPGARSLVLSSLFQLSAKANRSVVYVTTGTPEADTLASEVSLFLDSNQVVVLPEIDGIPYEWSRRDMVLSGRRIRAIDRLLQKSPVLLIVPAGALLRQIQNPQTWKDWLVQLKKGQTIEPIDLIQKLVDVGYHRTERVEGPGEFCLKGSLLDVFPVQSSFPIRIDFFDIEIDSIRQFNAETQRSLENLNQATILPATEALVDEAGLSKLNKKIESYSSKLRRPDWLLNFNLKNANGRDQAGLEELLPLVQNYISVIDLFELAPVVCLDSDGFALDRAVRVEREYDTLFDREKDSRITVEPDRLINRSVLELLNPHIGLIEQKPTSHNKNIDHENLLRVILHSEHVNLDTGKSNAADTNTIDNNTFENSTIGSFTPMIQAPSSFAGKMTEFRKRATSILDENGSLVITSPYTAQIQRIAGILKAESIPHETLDWNGPKTKIPTGKVILLQSLRQTGFELPSQSFYIWTDADIFGRSYKRRVNFKKTGSAPIESYLDLHEGDVVVHINHGVGRFVKLERMKAAGRERDFLVLEYADQDRLFVPLDQISMVQKYVAPESNPILDHLGRASFKKIREKVEKNIEKFAEDLIQIYAARSKLQGYAFAADTIWQEEFEAEFPYVETPDQLTAIQATKEDMESSRPMDRLICGDVGYGKTEVAIRAIFKAVMGGKQAIVICPTTILALQHFKNFKERFTNFPVRIDWMSRFRTAAEIRKTKEALAGGEVDVVVGTHALLAKDIKIRNMGLLVIDEEQRFGVGHKEALKKLKTQVDVLALSATPIPRTLHLSLTGIRDLSVIQTPPRDRKPVKTFVLEDSDSSLVEAVQRELERGGQIFYLHNRIRSLEMVAARLRMILPEVRFVQLHGQMDEDDIEQILIDFTDRKYDLLLTTAIIENGIDIPNVNTLIVDRADQFGLSQLYQIRGRVGRSSRQAYAYFFQQGSRSLTEQAMKRLNTLLEYQDLGSGFKVAMRDLEIRGAGNVLGKEQSGDIIQVGYELYIKLLDNAVKRLKGEELEIEVRCTVNLNADFYLSETYIEDTRQRIEFYKRFEAARSDQEILNLVAEMTDRFGEPDEPGRIFILVERIRCFGSICGFEHIYQDGDLIHFKTGDAFKVPIQHTIEILKKNVGFFIKDGRNNVLFYKLPKSKPKLAESFTKAIEPLLSAMGQLAEPLISREPVGVD